MPSRSFRQESSVYLYYDVYNLLRGANGRTRYRVDYEARGGARMPRVDYLRESRDSSAETRTGKGSRGYTRNYTDCQGFAVPPCGQRGIQALLELK